MQQGNLPLCAESDLPFKVSNQRIIGEWDNRQVAMATPVDMNNERPDIQTPIYTDSELELNGFVSARYALNIPYQQFLLVSKARQFVHMLNSQRFCSICGAETEFNEKESAMQCSKCQTLSYPRISPCVIMAVTKGDKLLMGCHTRHEINKMYTVLAGYVEVGESLEECVAREVYEEAGIRVKNIKYFASQPWPFPSQLMIAFTAEYESGEIKVDPEELSDAQWFSKDELPEFIPPQGTAARALIENAFNMDEPIWN